MGRASQQQAQQSRARIVDSANRLFRQHGVDHVSVAQVMHACDMTVGGFYKHFASKEALVAEVCALAFTQSLTTWQRVFEQEHSAVQPPHAELVHGYLGNRAPQRRCPILAYAPADGVPGDAVYRQGTQELFERFVAQAGEGAGARGQAMVLFAAMVGARMLDQATGSAPWVQELEAAVNAAAAAAVPTHPTS